MKRILLLATLFAISAAGAQAQSLKKDPDSYHVIITLANGEKVDGYLKSGWHAENSLLKKENYSFKVIKNLQDIRSLSNIRPRRSFPSNIRTPPRPIPMEHAGNPAPWPRPG